VGDAVEVVTGFGWTPAKVVAINGNSYLVPITFRSGKATMPDVGENDEVFECWMDGGKLFLHQPGKSNLDMPIDINNDGTLQTPLGEIKKKGN
jgi:hypothetical protein